MSHDGVKGRQVAKEIVGKALVHPGSRPVVEPSEIDLDEVRPLRDAVERNNRKSLLRLLKDEWVEMLPASGTPLECRGGWMHIERLV
jgi:hypothetical protein